MTPIAGNLAQVIDRWSDQETGILTRATVLQTLWDDQHLGLNPFDPDGIDRLIDALRRDTFFRVRPQTSRLRRGMFANGGGIRTEGDLHDFLVS